MSPHGNVIPFPTGRAGKVTGPRKGRRRDAETALALARLKARWMAKWNDLPSLLLRVQEVLDDERERLTRHD